MSICHSYNIKSFISTTPPLSLSSLNLSLGQDPASNRQSRNTGIPSLRLGLGADLDPDFLVIAVLDDDRAGAIRVKSANSLHAGVVVKQVASGTVNDNSALGNVLAELSHHVVVNLLLVAAAIRADGNETRALVAVAAAGEGRAAAGVGTKSPGDDAVGPVLEREHVEAGAVDPVSGADGGPALSHVLLLVGELVVELGERSPVVGVVAGVAVPSSSLDVLAGHVHDSLRVRVDV